MLGEGGIILVKSVVFVANISEELIGKSISGFVLKKVYRGNSTEFLRSNTLFWDFADRYFSYGKYVRFNEIDSFFYEDGKGEYYLLRSSIGNECGHWVFHSDFYACAKSRNNQKRIAASGIGGCKIQILRVNNGYREWRHISC
nr:hypothetical protein [uncultured Clostridium sp.]